MGGLRRRGPVHYAMPSTSKNTGYRCRYIRLDFSCQQDSGVARVSSGGSGGDEEMPSLSHSEDSSLQRCGRKGKRRRRWAHAVDMQGSLKPNLKPKSDALHPSLVPGPKAPVNLHAFQSLRYNPTLLYLQPPIVRNPPRQWLPSQENPHSLDWM